jgi:hypothetical protein
MLIVWISVIRLIWRRRAWRRSKPSGPGVRPETAMATTTSVITCKKEENYEGRANNHSKGNPAAPAIPGAVVASTSPIIVITYFSLIEEPHGGWRTSSIHGLVWMT